MQQYKSTSFCHEIVMNKSLHCFTAISTVLFALTMASASQSSQGNLAETQKAASNSSNPKITSAYNPNLITKNSQKSNTSATAQIALATYLKKIGARFYGAFWCPYCNQQKKMFGEQAFRQINYIECDARGSNPRPDLCRKANITGFPTWEINGKQYRGMKSLQELAELSGYKGDEPKVPLRDRNFAN